MNYLFENDKGDRLSFPSEITLAELVWRGITIRVAPKEEPLLKGEYAHNPENPNHTI